MHCETEPWVLEWTEEREAENVVEVQVGQEGGGAQGPTDAARFLQEVGPQGP